MGKGEGKRRTNDKCGEKNKNLEQRAEKIIGKQVLRETAIKTNRNIRNILKSYADIQT